MTRIRHAADTVLRRSPVQRAFRGRAARRVAVLAYHGVDSPQQFGRQLDLLQHEASPVSLADVVAAHDGGPPLPARPVLLTFDDGHPSLLRAGLPLLRARGIPAVAFVLPGLVGTHRPFWWDEAAGLHEAGARAAGAPDDPDDLVRWLKTVPDPRRHEVLAEMRELSAVDVTADQLETDDLLRLRDGGVAIGNHTWTHPCLDLCTPQELQRQVCRAHESLTDVLGEAPTAFAYPNGNHDPRAERLLGELGYGAGFLFDHRLARAPGRAGHRLRISRLRVSTTTSLDRFATILSGLHPALHHARGRA